MSAAQAVAFWGLRVPAGDEPTPVMSDIPGVTTIRITMAAIDPNEKALEADQPKRATLKLMRRPLDTDDYDDDEEDDELSEIDSDEEDELEKIQKTSKKLSKKEADAAIKKALKTAQANAMEVGAEDDDSEDFEIEEFVICTLDPERQYQQTLDIVIGEDEEAFFKVTGNFDISLSGNYIVPVRGGLDEDDEDDEDEDDEDYDLSPDEDELMNMLGSAADDSEDELDDVETPRITEVDSDEEKAKAEKKPTKVEKKNLKRTAEEGSKSEEPKLSKKQLKKLKANDGKAVNTTADTPDKKKVQFAKPIEQGPTNTKKDTKKTPEKAEKVAVAASPAKKIVSGVTIEDKKTGTGAIAKNGNKLGMRYIGKLNNGKVFDQNTKGKPFTFRLGKGEVIKGWDVGLAGMQVGGERRITIPASMAYGKKSLPGIPANSTLTFDVKLLEVK